MKTPESIYTRSITITISATEAMTVLNLLVEKRRCLFPKPYSDSTPPDFNSIANVIKGSLAAECPDLYEMWFGGKPQDFDPPPHFAPLP